MLTLALVQDIDLCNNLGAVKGEDVKDRHGVDLVIGGHDHVYYVRHGSSLLASLRIADRHFRSAEAQTIGKASLETKRFAAPKRTRACTLSSLAQTFATCPRQV